MVFPSRRVLGPNLDCLPSIGQLFGFSLASDPSGGKEGPTFGLLAPSPFLSVPILPLLFLGEIYTEKNTK